MDNPEQSFDENEKSSLSLSFLTTNGIRLHVAEAGPPDGPPVILLHGFPEFWRGWKRQIPALAQAGFHVIAPDQRGYNLSDKPAWVVGYRLETLVNDIVGLLDHYGHDRAAVIGHDWGGAVAWAFALTRPDRLSRLIALNTAPPQVMVPYARRHLSQALRSLYILAFQIPRLPELFWRRNGFAAGIRSLRGSSQPGTFSAADIAQYIAAWSQPGAQTAMLNWYRASIRYPFPPVATSVTAPTLILWGEQDAFLNTDLAYESAKLCADARVVTFPDATHWVQHEAAPQLNQELLSFLSI